MTKRADIIQKFLDSFSDAEKNDLMEADEELASFNEFMLAKEKASKKELTGTNQLEGEDVQGTQE